MSGSFLDSNIFIYLFDDTDADKQQRASSLVHDALASGAAHISFQVVQEVLNILTRKLAVSPADALRFMTSTLVPLWQVMPSSRLYERALALQTRYRFSFYDSLIVAAALSAGCTRLYSEDLQHAQRVEGLTVENPFL